MIVGAYLDHMAPDHPAGAEWCVYDAFAWLARRGHDCRVASRLDYTQERTPSGVLLYGHPTSEELAQHYQECDVMLTQLGGTMDAQILAATYQTPLVQYVHSETQIDELGVVPSCSALVVFNAQHVADACAFWPGHSIVLRPPIDADRVRVEPGACTTLVNLSAAKGGPALWRLALDNEQVPLLGVQGAYDTQAIGPAGLALHSAFENADTGLPANLSILPPQRDIREALRYTRQLLVLSATETYGRIAGEAAVSGIPTITVDTPGLRECLGASAAYVDRDASGQLQAIIKRGYTPAWKEWSLAAERQWNDVLAPRQETELRRFERALRRVVKEQKEMTL